MSPPIRRSIPGSTWLAVSLLGLGAEGCATLFGMDDASCSDCLMTGVMSEQPASGGTDPAQDGSGGARAAAPPSEANSPPANLDPGPTAPGVAARPPLARLPDAGVDSGDPPAQQDPCIRYCDAVMNTCLPGGAALRDNRAYVDRDACLKLCPYFPSAVAGEPAGKNTLECRLGLLDSAEANERSTVCQAAGRSGQAGANPVCGSNCETYCSLMQQICPAEFSRLAPSCESVCAGLGDELAFDVTRDELSGNTVQCRLWHLGVAATCDPLRVATCLPLHCGHSAGGSPCDGPAAP